MPIIEIPAEYGYVLLAATSTFVLNVVHSFNTGKYRKQAKVDYPAAYAPSSNTSPEAFRFNCAQRAHANFTENQPSLLGALLVAGLRFPVTSAVMGACWSLSRFAYMVGYSSGEAGGKGRYKKGGLLHNVFQLGLICLATYNGVTLVLSK
ncbi:MAPEG family protein [Phlyctema vagabunda]|uniref:MAPEG family protein n=1 Tax=Phlyctema vagabunda TaxID=108571 RepID=A0ABR4PNV8_9HELO